MSVISSTLKEGSILLSKCVFSGSQGRGRPHVPNPLPACAAQHHGAHDRHLHRDHWRRDHCRGLPELPRSWASPRCHQLGGDAQLGRTPIHGEGPGAGSLARAFPVHRCLGHQLVRRRVERPARPQPEGWCRALWSREDEEGSMK